MRGPRGSLSRLYDAASQIAQARLELVGQYLDDIAENSEPPTGGRLTNDAFRALLRESPDFQQHLLEKQPFMTTAERTKLQQEIERILPQELPASVTAIPPRPWETPA